MKEILLKYLLQFQRLGLPGIGYLQLHIRASQTDIVGKRILPPTPAFRLTGDIPAASEKELVHFVAGKMQVSEDVADREIHEFCNSALEGIKKGVPLEWEGFGSIRKGIAGEMTFDLASKTIFAFPPVPAERVIRTNAEHTILVGDTEKTTTQMSELLLEEPTIRKRSGWWVWALILLIVGGVAIGFYLYQHNGRIDGFRNQQSLPQP